MFLKWPLIGGLLLVLIARWWAKRSTRFRRGALAVGWLVVGAQAVSAARRTWGAPEEPEPASVVLGAWVILAMLGAVVVWLQRDTRPDPATAQAAPRRGQAGGPRTGSGRARQAAASRSAPRRRKR